MHVLSVTVKKENYVDKTFTKTVSVVQELQEPTYSFTPDFTTESNGQWIEVENDDSEITCTITADTDCTLEVTDDFNSLSATTTVNTCNFTVKGIGQHNLTVKVKRQNYVTKTFTKTVTVVQQLQPPTYSFDPGHTQASNGQWIEVADDNTQINCTVTADSGCTLEITDNLNNRSITTATNYGTLTTSGINDHTLTVKVKKSNYVTRTFTKTFKVVQELQEPTYSFTPNFTTESNGQWIEVENGNSEITCTMTDATGCTLEVTDNFNNTSTPITVNNNKFTIKGIGQHNLTIKVKKQNYETKTFTKTVTVVQQLQPPSYSFDPGHTQASNGQWIEVAGDNTQINCTVTADSGCTLEITDNINNLSTTTATNYGTLATRGINDHTLIVKVKKTNYVTRTFTKTFKVVQELQEPTYSFTPNFTTESNGHWIEVENGNSEITCTMTADTGCTFEVTDVFDNTSTPITVNTNRFTVKGIGQHNLTVKVKKQNYVTKTFTKTVTVVQKLQEPTLKLYKESSRETTVNSSTDYEGDASYSSYTNYNVTLDGDGNAVLYFTFTSPDGATIKVTDKAADNSTSTTNGGTGSFTKLGPHDVSIEVTKTNYHKQVFNEKIYVQGILSAPEFKANGTKQSDSGDGSSAVNAEKWQFSYLTYEAMEWWIEPGNTDNTTTVKYNGSTINPSASPLVPNNTFCLLIEQTRNYCKSLQTTKYVDVKIKPITVKLGKSYLYCDFDDGAAGDAVEIYGKVHLGYDNSYTCLKTFNSNYDYYTPFEWGEFTKDRSPQYTLNSPSDSLHYYSEGMYEDDVTGDDELENVSKSVTLSYLAEQYRLGKPANNFDNVKLEVFNSGTAGDTRMGHRIMFNLSE